MFIVEEFSPQANQWYQIEAETENEQQAANSVRYLTRKNGKYYRYREIWKETEKNNDRKT